MGVPKIGGVPYSGVLILRILLFRVLCKGPLFSVTPRSAGGRKAPARLGFWASLGLEGSVLGLLDLGLRAIFCFMCPDSEFGTGHRRNVSEHDIWKHSDLKP